MHIICCINSYTIKIWGGTIFQARTKVRVRQTGERERKRETERLSNGYQNLLKIGDKDCQGIITIIIAFVLDMCLEECQLHFLN